MGKGAGDWQAVRDLIAKIEGACEGGEAVFRGEPEQYQKVQDKVPAASRLYRKYLEYRKSESGKPAIEGRDFRLIDIERGIVERARKKLYRDAKPAREILTDLRHFGADTALIDFTRSVLVALFFACIREQRKAGCVIVLPTHGLAELGSDEEIYRDGRSEPALISPAPSELSRTRVEAQRSVFVHAPGGYVEMEGGMCSVVEVPAPLQIDCLNYLARFHNIEQEVMFNDLFGFIEQEANFDAGNFSYYLGLDQKAGGAP